MSDLVDTSDELPVNDDELVSIKRGVLRDAVGLIRAQAEDRRGADATIAAIYAVIGEPTPEEIP